jgi:hypothetical protein
MIMVDLEGTLSDHSTRLATLLENEEKYVKRDRTAWKEYYKGLIDDPPRSHIMGLVREYISEDIRPLIYSTRFVNKYKHEEEWLKLHGLWGEVDLLQRESHMTKIKGPDLVVQWVRQYEPLLLVDDREEVRELVRALPGSCVAYAPEAFINLEEL